MEKRISFFQFQSVKNVAKAIDPKLKEKVALQKRATALKAELDAKLERLQKEIKEKKDKLQAEYDACETQINLLEAGIVQTLGVHVYDLVKKVIEPTGKTDPKTGKVLMSTKYLPTEFVTYDAQTREYVISIPEEGDATEEVKEEKEEEAPEFDGAGFTEEDNIEEPKDETEQMPWEK